MHFYPAPQVILSPEVYGHPWPNTVIVIRDAVQAARLSVSSLRKTTLAQCTIGVILWEVLLHMGLVCPLLYKPSLQLRRSFALEKPGRMVLNSTTAARDRGPSDTSEESTSLSWRDSLWAVP